MKIIRGVDEMQRLALTLRSEGKSIGCVPTMGYLHDGHASLIRRARAENDACVVTLFVNPTQFTKNEDLARYPRNEAGDAALAEDLGADVLFAPEAAEMYPPGFQTTVDVTEVSRPLCGASRPGHFGGVAVVVTKLFMILQPTRAYFGLKDFQQCRVIARLVADLNIPVAPIFCPTVREVDGLAMSSRNAYLSPEERQAARALRRALLQAQAAHHGGERNAATLRALVQETIAAEPLATIDYVEAVDAQTLHPATRADRPTLMAVAVRFGNARLIDNILLETENRPCCV
jgi:pantoate--beta-alanine ligase